MGRKAVLTDEQRKERKILSNAKWRQANKERANELSRLHHQKNKEERNRKRREKRAKENAQQIKVIIDPKEKIVSV